MDARDGACYPRRPFREGRFDQIDKVALAGEVESLGKRDRRELASRMTVILVHMLKANYQPDRAGASRRATLQTQRRELTDLFEDSPSLRSQAGIAAPGLSKRPSRRRQRNGSRHRNVSGNVPVDGRTSARIIQ